MEYFWLIILAFIIFRAIAGQPRRYEPRGKYDVPREDFPYKEEELPYSYSDEELLLEGFPTGQPVESRPELNLPPEPAGRGVALTKEPGYVSRQEGPVRELRQSTATRREQELKGRRSEEELFADGLSRQEVIKGIVWSQILGPRGGMQANRHFRYK